MSLACRIWLISVYYLIFLTLTCISVFSMAGPSYMKGYTGKDALFLWNTTDQREILWVSWGIRNGNIADPQFITVNGYTGRVNINTELDETLRKRVSYIGNLKEGRAWFVLKNLTVNDTNEYIASISVDGTRVLPYYVRLNVVEERKGIVRFTQYPPLVVSVDEGGTKTLKWEYYISDKSDLSLKSPIWDFSKDGSTWTEIASEAAANSWKWTISPTCPESLKPRLKKVSNATIKIINAKLNDAGKYRCRLERSSLSMLSKETTLHVTKDNCSSSPCLNGGHCTSGQYGFHCTCLPGWSGKTCDRRTEGLPPKDRNDPVNLIVRTLVVSLASLAAVAITIVIVAFLIKKKNVAHEDGSQIVFL